MRAAAGLGISLLLSLSITAQKEVTWNMCPEKIKSPQLGSTCTRDRLLKTSPQEIESRYLSGRAEFAHSKSKSDTSVSRSYVSIVSHHLDASTEFFLVY